MSEFNQGECLPSDGCGCIGHRMPGVSHIRACCNKPHITEEEYERLAQLADDVIGEFGGDNRD